MELTEEASLRVLVLAPIGRDASATANVLRKDGLEADVCDNLSALVRGLSSGAGAVFVAEEALFNADKEILEQWIEQQPAWSDLPSSS
jgi:hypothetical protein